MLNILSYIVAVLYLYVIFTNYRLYKGRHESKGSIRAKVLAAVAVHAVYLVWLMFDQTHLFINNHFEMLALMNLLTVVIYVAMQYSTKLPGAGIFLFPFTFVLHVFSIFSPMLPMNSDVILMNPYYVTHVVLVIVGSSFFQIAMFYGALFIILHNHLKAKNISNVVSYLPNMTSLEKLSSKTALFGFVIYTLAMITGSTWAGYVWDAAHTSTVKIILDFVILLIFGMSFQMKYFKGWQGKRVSYVLVLGGIMAFFSIFWN